MAQYKGGERWRNYNPEYDDEWCRKYEYKEVEGEEHGNVSTMRELNKIVKME